MAAPSAVDMIDPRRWLKGAGSLGMFFALALAFTLISDTAEAQSRCFVREEPLPRSCAALNARGARELWKGDFSGRCLSGDRTRRLFGHGCFRSEPDCTTWLARMRSLANESIRQARCRRL